MRKQNVPALAKSLLALSLISLASPALRADEEVKTLKQAQAEAAAKKKKKKKADDATAATSDAPAASYPGLPPLPNDPAAAPALAADAPPARTGVIIPGQAAPPPDPDAARAGAPAPAYVPPAPEPLPAPAAQTYTPPPAAAAPPPEPSYGPASSREVEQMLQSAAQAEKAQQCEVAYQGYQAALDRAGRVPDKARSGELESIAQNKIDKLEECYRACQPNARQRSLFESAQGAKDRGESKRATQIARKLLTGRDQRCVFWGSVHEFLASMPGQADELANDRADPCEVTPEVQKDLDGARSSARREQQQLSDLMNDRAHLSSRMDELVSLWRDLDSTRQRIFEMREEFLDCDAVYKPLVEDAAGLHDTFEKSEGVILASYRGQIEALSKKVRSAQALLSERGKLLDSRSAELERLKKQMDEMGAVNEDLYNDLFNLGAAESINFTTTVEGRRIEKPIEEINALMADESKVISTLQSKYPEYFTDGVNVEAMKRKKLVLEKVEQLMEKLQRQNGTSHPGGGRAIDEINATIRMLDKAIGSKSAQASAAAGEKKGESGGGVPAWIFVVGSLLAIGGFVFWRIKSSSHTDERTGIR